jgi:S-adenosylmethionine decarboxylase
MSINDMKPLNYGTHIMLLLSNVKNRDVLDSPKGLCDFLRDLVAKVGMRVLDGPRAATESGDSEKYGHSAVIILYESHAAVHTYPVRGSLFLDLFSCKPFDDEDVISACHEFLGEFEVSERLLLDRGAHWNGSAETSIRDWAGTRDDVVLGNLTATQ